MAGGLGNPCQVCVPSHRHCLVFCWQGPACAPGQSGWPPRRPLLGPRAASALPAPHLCALPGCYGVLAPPRPQMGSAGVQPRLPRVYHPLVPPVALPGGQWVSFQPLLLSLASRCAPSLSARDFSLNCCSCVSVADNRDSLAGVALVSGQFLRRRKGPAAKWSVLSGQLTSGIRSFRQDLPKDSCSLMSFKYTYC